MAEDRETRGGCLCGAFRYTVRGQMREVVNCHCGQCRKFHGHFAAYTDALLAEVTMEGEDQLGWFQSSSFARRGFCKSCGSSLFWHRLGSERVSIAAGTVDDPTHLHTTRHIFVRDKGDYYDIADDLPRAPGTTGT